MAAACYEESQLLKKKGVEKFISPTLILSVMKTFTSIQWLMKLGRFTGRRRKLIYIKYFILGHTDCRYTRSKNGKNKDL
jgi:hypothetical protein